MNIKDTLHKILFPSHFDEILRLRIERSSLRNKYEGTLEEFDSYKKKHSESTHADLMRSNLGSLVLDFTKEPDYLDGQTESERKDRIIQANELYKNKMFDIIFEHLVNKQGNFTLKRATNDAQIFAGRLNINGMTLFKNEVDRCHILFEEMVTPEKIDPQELL